MNSKNRKTLEAIFHQPSRSDIKWDDMKALLFAVGATLQEREGSRVRFVIGSTGLALHRPHSGKELREYQVDIIRRFLNSVEVKP